MKKFLYLLSAIIILLNIACKKDKSLKPIAEGKPKPTPYAIIPVLNGGGNNGNGNGNGNNNGIVGVNSDSIFGFISNNAQLCAGKIGDTTLIPFALGNCWGFIFDTLDPVNSSFVLRVDSVITIDSTVKPIFGSASVKVYQVGKYTNLNNLPIRYDYYRVNNFGEVFIETALGNGINISPSNIAAYDTNLSILYTPKNIDLVPSNQFVNDGFLNIAFEVEAVNNAFTSPSCSYTNLVLISYQYSNRTDFIDYKIGLGFVATENSDDDGYKFVLRAVKLN